MALLEVMRRLRPLHKYKLSAVHIHHGISGNKSQLKYRDNAQALVREFCLSNKIHFLSNKTYAAAELKSEAQLRKFRLKCFLQLKKSYPEAIFVTGHHLEDLLETRLLQIIRGTGARGLVYAHGFMNAAYLPLQNISKEQITNYAKSRGLSWLEDPSNQNVDLMRNWLRNQWLPSLESYSEGSLRRMGISLNLISEELRTSLQTQNYEFLSIISKEGHIARPRYNQLSPEQKLSFISWYFKSRGFRSYTQNHAKEFRKRLDSPHKRFSFKLLKSVWHVDQSHVLYLK